MGAVVKLYKKLNNKRGIPRTQLNSIACECTSLKTGKTYSGYLVDISHSGLAFNIIGDHFEVNSEIVVTLGDGHNNYALKAKVNIFEVIGSHESESAPLVRVAVELSKPIDDLLIKSIVEQGRRAAA